MNFRKNHVWFDRLPDIIHGINEMKRPILFGFSSSEVRNNADISSIVRKKSMKRLYEYQSRFENKQPTFQINDIVKKVAYVGKFHRGYEKKTESGTFKIVKILRTAPFTYLLDDNSRPYYAEELIRSGPDSPTKNENKFDLYIKAKKPVHRRTLRSGETGESDDYIYHLMSHSSAHINDWIDEREKNNLIRDGKLPNTLFT